MEEEIWLPIAGYIGLYEISSLGRVKSLANSKDKKEKILVPSRKKEGYKSVILWSNRHTKAFRVHRLVGYAFMGLTDDKYIDHINGIPGDDRVSNLRICDNRENQSFDNVKRKKTSKYVGVSWHGHQWKSQIKHEGKVRYLGVFYNEIDAHNAYQKALNAILQAQTGVAGPVYPMQSGNPVFQALNPANGTILSE